MSSKRSPSYYIILDLVTRTQVTKDVTDAVEYMIEKILHDCSNNPKAVGSLLVSLTTIMIN